MPRKLTQEDFIKKASERRSDNPDLSKFIYRDTHTKGIVVCHKHGDWEISPANLLNGYICPKCSYEKRGLNCRKGFDVFAAEVFEKHGDNVSLEKFKYTHQNEKSTATCREHGDFEISPKCLLKGGCYRCGLIKISDKSRARESEIFQSRMKETYDDKLNFSMFIYNGDSVPGLVKCPHHGDFYMTPKILYRGARCRSCSRSISMKEVIWLDILGIPPQNRSFTIRCRDRRFIVDGYDHQRKIVYEFNGDEWHGNPIYFPSDEIHPIRKKPNGEAYRRTLEKEKILIEHGYTVVSIWESDFCRDLVEKNFDCGIEIPAYKKRVIKAAHESYVRKGRLQGLTKLGEDRKIP